MLATVFSMFKSLFVPAWVRGAILGACIALAAVCTGTTVLAPHSNTALLLAIFLLGPVSFLLDLANHRPETRRVHRLESHARVVCIGVLASELHKPNGALVVGLALTTFLVAFWMHTNYQKTVWRHSQFLSGCLAIAGWTVAVLAVLHLSENHVGLDPQWPTLMFGAVMMTCVAAFRTELWHSFQKPLSPSQHADLWPRLARTQSDRCWVELYLYFQRHKDLHAALRTLPLPTLLQWFDKEERFKQRTGVKPAVLDPFCEQVKMAINEKEPRAMVVWPLYSNEEAASIIGRMPASKMQSEPKTLELPAL